MSLIGVYDLWYQDVLLSNLQLTTTSNLLAIAHPFPVSLLHDTQTHNAFALAVIQITTYKDLSGNNATFMPWRCEVLCKTPNSILDLIL